MLGSSTNHSWPAEKHPTLCQRGAYEVPFIRRVADFLSWKSALTPWLEEALVSEIGGSTWSASSQANRWQHNRHRHTGSRMLSEARPITRAGTKMCRRQFRKCRLPGRPSRRLEPIATSGHVRIFSLIWSDRTDSSTPPPVLTRSFCVRQKFEMANYFF